MDEQVKQKSIWDNFELREKKEGKIDSFKIKQGNTEIEFVSEPRYWVDKKESDPVKQKHIIVDVKDGDNIRPWFIHGKNYTFLTGIKAMGSPLIGRKAIVGRKGEGRGVTEYSFTEIKE